MNDAENGIVTQSRVKAMAMAEAWRSGVDRKKSRMHAGAPEMCRRNKEEECGRQGAMMMIESWTGEDCGARVVVDRKE